MLLDDPLSALDAHVGKFIFENTLKKYWKNKTIIFITHALNYAQNFDHIIVFEDGKIKLNGTYDEVSHEPLFKNL